MNEVTWVDVATLLIALAAAIGSFWSLRFQYDNRHAPLRDELYKAQVRIVEEFAKPASRAVGLAAVAFDRWHDGKTVSNEVEEEGMMIKREFARLTTAVVFLFPVPAARAAFNFMTAASKGLDEPPMPPSECAAAKTELSRSFSAMINEMRATIGTTTLTADLLALSSTAVAASTASVVIKTTEG